MNDETRTTCDYCGWTTEGLLNVGQSQGKPKWICHGCVKRMADACGKNLTLVTEAKSESASEAVRMAIDEATSIASMNGNVNGNPVMTKDVKSVTVIPVDSNPLVPTSGTRSYQAIVVTSFPIKEEP